MCGSIDADAFAVTMQLTTTLRADAKMEEDEADNLEEELARELAALRDEDIDVDLSSLEDGELSLRADESHQCPCQQTG